MNKVVWCRGCGKEQEFDKLENILRLGWVYHPYPDWVHKPLYKYLYNKPIKRLIDGKFVVCVYCKGCMPEYGYKALREITRLNSVLIENAREVQ